MRSPAIGTPADCIGRTRAQSPRSTSSAAADRAALPGSSWRTLSCGASTPLAIQVAVADAPAWIALGIALYGGGLSTYNTVIERRGKLEELVRDVRVTGRMRPGADPSKPVLTVRAYNSKKRPVQVTRAGVVLRSGIIMWQGPSTPGLPARLDDGDSIEVPLAPEWLELTQAAMRQEIVGLAVEDASGTPHRSSPGPDSSPPAAPGPPLSE